TAALGNVGTVPFVVPWAEVGVMLAVALVAGLVASVLPARAAVRTRPVAALAAEETPLRRRAGPRRHRPLGCPAALPLLHRDHSGPSQRHRRPEESPWPASTRPSA